MYSHRRIGAWLIFLLAVFAAPRVSVAGDLARLRERGVLRVGTTGDYGPFSRARGDSFSGFDMDLMSRLAHDLGVRVQYVRVRWPDLTAALESNRFDLVASGVTVLPRRALMGRYTRPYAISGATALIRREDRDRLHDRLALNRPGARILVNHGGYLEQVAHRLFPRATIEPVSDNTLLPRRVLAGDADAALTDSVEVRAWQRKNLATVGPFTHDRKALLVRRDAAELTNWIDSWLRKRERDGWLSRLRRRWFGDAMFFAAGADREAVLSDVELRCGLMPAVAAIKRVKQLPIEDRVQEERVLERAKETARAAGLDPEPVGELFRSLIQAAKAIERSAQADPRAFAPPLEDLRRALDIIDTHLVDQLRAAARTVRPDQWRAGLGEGLNVEGLGDAMKAQLAQALAQRWTLVGPATTEAEPSSPGTVKKSR
jgi:cyclohexadienyl dehydratase